MKIHNLRPAVRHGSGRFRDVAIFDAEVADGLRLLGLRLSQAPDGRLFVFAPQKGSERFAQFTGDYARRLAEAAWRANGGDVAHDQSAA